MFNGGVISHREAVAPWSCSSRASNLISKLHPSGLRFSVPREAALSGLIRESAAAEVHRAEGRAGAFEKERERERSGPMMEDVRM